MTMESCCGSPMWFDTGMVMPKRIHGFVLRGGGGGGGWSQVV
eukprot:SAG25_NODE_6618_length_545_cov_0.800448_1_plen_41_part_01